MKKFAVSFLIITFIGCFVTIKAQTAWTGAYQFDEDGGKTAGGTAINIYHQLEIRESADGLMATLKSNGFQTSVDLICTAKAENNGSTANLVESGKIGKCLPNSFSIYC